MFRDTTVPCKVTDNLAQAQWEKLVWNIPFNGLGVAGAAGYDALTQLPSANSHLPSVGRCLTTDKLLADPRWEKLLRELMLEVIAAAGALGFEIPVAYAEEQIERTRTMALTRHPRFWISNWAGRWNWKACFSNRCAGRKRPACPCHAWPGSAKCCKQLDQTH